MSTDFARADFISTENIQWAALFVGDLVFLPEEAGGSFV